ncbi:MAG: hypothetical protein KatS3mg014_1483 [Actinomycetota bacterium]|nr:MAG: hypothetical protein KatS3mg014_1483 [Actinomycetota bacterium]
MPIGLSAFVICAVVLTFSLLLPGLWRDRAVITEHAVALSAWACAVLLVGMAAVPSESGTQLGLDMPLVIAGSFIFGPWIGGGLAFAAYSDIREFRREISLMRGLYNRSQVALSVMTAGAIFAALSPGGVRWPESVLAAGVAVAGDAIVNYALVGTAKALHEHESPLTTCLHLRLGSIGSFALTYLSYGLMSIVLTEVYKGAGTWGLVTFALPVFFARATFMKTRILEVADARLRQQSEALRDAASRLAEERRDERVAIAADLHDEVLPPLYQVHLMAQVIRQDLAGGRLLALEEDVPALVDAVGRASAAVRDVVRGLRKSPLGAAGFQRTVCLLVDQLRISTDAEFVLDLEDIDGPPMVQLLAYQVVREALTNATRHSGASRIRVVVRVEEGVVRLLIEDDGRGFDPQNVDMRSHFGLSIMKERVELIGGALHVVSGDGQRGSKVIARLPLVPEGNAYQCR